MDLREKRKNDDLISYQSGNETIIMPKRFRESSMWANILYIIIGLVVGVAVTCFLVVPGIKSQAKTDAKKQLLSANDTISTNGQTISGLNDQIDKLKKELEDEKKKKMMEYQTRFPHMRPCSMRLCILYNQ